MLVSGLSKRPRKTLAITAVQRIMLQLTCRDFRLDFRAMSLERVLQNPFYEVVKADTGSFCAVGKKRGDGQAGKGVDFQDHGLRTFIRRLDDHVCSGCTLAPESLVRFDGDFLSSLEDGFR